MSRPLNLKGPSSREEVEWDSRRATNPEHHKRLQAVRMGLEGSFTTGAALLERQSGPVVARV